MTRAYSQNLRDRVIAAVEDEGLSRREAARRYRISDAAAVRWLQALRQGRRGALAQGGDRRSRLSVHRTWLLALIEAEPDLTLLAVAERLQAEHGVKADAGMLSRFFRDCQEFCAGGHEMEWEGPSIWRSTKTCWTSCWLVVICRCK